MSRSDEKAAISRDEIVDPASPSSPVPQIPPKPGDVTGLAMINKSTKDLAKVIKPGSIAVIDHLDLDRVAAESLVERGISAVINASASSSGRYPNEGPLVILKAGIALLDEAGPEIMSALSDGDTLVIRGDQILSAKEVERSGEVAPAFSGKRQDVASIKEIHDASRATLGAEFIRFVENTSEYFEHNKDLVSDDLDVPDVGVKFQDRHVLMVVRGHDYKQDLMLLRSSGYINDRKPILIGVDGGADAIMEVGLRPDIIVGDFDSVSEASLLSGAKLVVHAFPDGRAPGAERLTELGLDHFEFRASGTSEDIAMLMAFEQGASLIVAVGTHSSMVDFLDKGRAGMASTILTRMKVGPVLVDAKGVSRLYQQNIRKRDVLLLVVGAFLSMLAIAFVSEPVQLIIRSIWSDLTG